MEKEEFVTLKIKQSVVKRFRDYSRTISKSQSMTLLVMLEFFQNNGISPLDSLESNIIASEARILKRINAVIAIMKDMEKTQTKPTAAMILSLFEETASKEKPLILEKKILKEKSLMYRDQLDKK